MRSEASAADRPQTIGVLARRRQSISPALPCDAVARIFRADPDRRSVVVGAGASARLLNRSEFFQVMTGPRGYGWALYHRRPIGSLPTAGSSEALILRADTTLADAGLAALQANLSSFDDVLVDFGEGDLATVSVSELFAALARHNARQADEAELRERHFKAVIENLSDGITILDADGTVRYMSTSGGVLTGRVPAERVGRSAFEFAHPDDLPGLTMMVGRALASPGVIHKGEFRMLAPDGETRRFEFVTRNLLDDPAVNGIIVNYRDVTDQRRLEEQLRHQAFHDPLTGLANRALLLDRISSGIARARRSGKGVAVAYLDLDGFKSVNDRWGHRAGDDLLRAVAEALANHTRAEDTLSRLGGDEFALVLADLDDIGEAMLSASRLHAALNRTFLTLGNEVTIHASVGMAATVGGGIDADELLRRADHAMYVAKTQGKNRTVHWDANLEHQVMEDQRLAADLLTAVSDHQISVAYQPIIELGTGRVTGVEALARWAHPEHGQVPPDRFIVLAEQTGSIGGIGRFVMETACRQVAEWQRDLADPLLLSVNISPAELTEGLQLEVESALALSGLPAAQLQLEITETSLISCVTSARIALEQVRTLGVRIAIDDFGTGYSSLSYLRDLPIDNIKLDKTFVAGLGGDADDSQLVEGVITLAHSLGLDVTAEGIEHEHQARALARMTCDTAQGFYYARPSATPALYFSPHARAIAG